jgi:hypothetical protein
MNTQRSDQNMHKDISKNITNLLISKHRAIDEKSKNVWLIPAISRAKLVSYLSGELPPFER